MLSLVSVVETRGIEPLTPALQKHGVTDGRMECAGRSDVIAGMVARVGHRGRELAAIVAAIIDKNELPRPAELVEHFADAIMEDRKRLDFIINWDGDRDHQGARKRGGIKWP